MSRALKVGIGHAETAKEAAKMATDGLTKPTLTIVFASSNHNPQQVYEDVKSIVKTGHIIGGTTAGEITSLEGARTGTVAVMCLESSMLKVGVGVGENLSQNPKHAGITACQKSYEMITKDPALASFIFLGYLRAKKLNLLNINPFVTMFLPDGLQGSEEEALRGALSTMGRSSRIVGGSTGDDLKFQKTYQIANGVYTDSVIATKLCSLKMGVGMAHPYVPTDKGAVVTKSNGRIVYELNGRPAAEVMRELLDVDELTPEVFAENPIGVRTGDVFADYIIKSFVTENPDGSLPCYAEVHEGSYISLMKTDKKTTEERFKFALKSAIEDAGNPEEIGAIIVFNCILRGILTQKLGVDDIKIAQEVVGKDVPVIGFNTYGEQGATRGGSMGHYNQTSTVLVISKEPLSQ